jgi:hypothetical protein
VVEENTSGEREGIASAKKKRRVDATLPFPFSLLTVVAEERERRSLSLSLFLGIPSEEGSAVAHLLPFFLSAVPSLPPGGAGRAGRGEDTETTISDSSSGGASGFLFVR